MFELPKDCYVNKFLPKKIFYEKVGVSSGVKDEFINLVDRITWLYKLSPATIGIPKTDLIEEIQIFQIDVKEKRIPLSVIKTITKGVQYKILFLIKYNDEFCYSIKVDDIFVTDWNEEISFDFNAINLKIVYENIVKSIIGEKNNTNQFDEIIEKKKKKASLEKRIIQLRQKIKTEKQFNRKLELNIELNNLTKEMEEFDYE
jgi:hypothetical protein